MRRKICVVTANRADWSRLQTVVEEINKHPKLRLALVVMGSHLLTKTGKTISEIKKRGTRIARVLKLPSCKDTPESMAVLTGLYTAKLAKVFAELKPDIVLAPVDRFESLSMGVAAALQNIHVAHLQGGEVTGTIDESIRHALTKLSHLHFVSTLKSKRRVVAMGERQEYVFNFGCPASDLLLRARTLSRKETITQVNALLSGNKMSTDQSFSLIIQHPVTTEFGESRKHMRETLEALKDIPGQLLLLWPNIDAGRDAITKLIGTYAKKSPIAHRLFLASNIPTQLFPNVLRHATLMLGNSSSGIREACYFGTPVVNIGSRQNKRERGRNVLDAENKCSKIVRAALRQIKAGKYPKEALFGTGKSGKKIADTLATITLPPIQKTITY